MEQTPDKVEDVMTDVNKPTSKMAMFQLVGKKLSTSQLV